MTEAERVKPRAMFVEEAIQLALDSRWDEAVTVNRRLIEQHGADEEALNRLGKALTETGQLEEALATYRQTLELNPANMIAPKMIRKIQALVEKPSRGEGGAQAIDVDLFTEEPGKSALTTLVTRGAGVSDAVVPGDAVDIVAEGDKLRARSVRGVDLGDVDNKLTRRLLPLIATGNRYAAAVARIADGRIEVMLREVFQAPENARKTSFPIARGARAADFRPYAKESLLAARGGEVGLDDDEDLRPDPIETEDDLEGLQPVEGDLDEAPIDTYDDDADDDGSRPEDSY